ncbi:hypothetical protein EI94DRAFT_1810991 [Lactarius quietus]|nr:hypothetical protein EI94DRAFT_1810991 [Lactarius quietus]
MVHDDALMIFSESPFFIPLLIALLADLSTSLWGEEPELMASPELLSEMVAGIAQGVLLCTTSSSVHPKVPQRRDKKRLCNGLLIHQINEDIGYFEMITRDYVHKDEERIAIT